MAAGIGLTGRAKSDGQTRNYSELIIYTVIIVILVSAVFITYFVSIKESLPYTQLINLGGQQGVLSQRMAKSILNIRLNVLLDKPVDAEMKEMMSSYNTFNEIINALDKGGGVKEPDGRTEEIDAIHDASAREPLKKGLQLWGGYRAVVSKAFRKAKKDEKTDSLILIADGLRVTKNDLTLVAEGFAKNNLPLLNEMNLMTQRLKESSERRANNYRGIQIGFALFAFFILILGIVRTSSLFRNQDQVIESQIGELRMSQKELSKYSQGLEKMVDNRTRELRESEAELAKYSQGLEKMVDARTKELKESQSLLFQSEKMASLGQMVAGLAHEINTPLGYVRNNVELLRGTQNEMRVLIHQFKITQEKLVNGDFTELENLIVKNEMTLQQLERKMVYQQASEFFDGSLEGLDRIQDLIFNLKNFSRLDEAEMKETDINQGLESTLKIAHNAIKHKVTITKNYGQLPLVKCYPAQMNQVFLNLITNAAQACEKPNEPSFRGILTLTTAFKGDKVMIEIADNGQGIPPENLNRIFEPFFTTKPVGKGTGLGLSIVYKIIEQHNGLIAVKSEPGIGTAFTIELPVAVHAVEESDLFAD
ncbi:MAG: GHKL domain-containing protein [Rhizobacter sp.]|nr:GHKL domain-containing protein [Chlorobiales bacterium]